MDELTKLIQDEVHWCMLFAHDIVLADETVGEVNVKLETWRDGLHSKAFWLSKTKIEYIWYKLVK